MKVFWIIMGLLAVLVVAMMWPGMGAEDSPRTEQNARLVTPQPPNTMTSTAKTPVQPVEAATATGPEKPTDRGLTEEEAKALAEELLQASERAAASNQPASHAHASTPAVNPLASIAGGPASAGKSTSDAAATSQSAAPTTHSIKRQDDGSILVDDKFVVRGSGSAQDPYQISWDLLVSATETYQPRLGMTEIPQRVQMLNGHHVKITGYLAFPLAQTSSDEVLVMLNMWDGCCIGVPPSPYDAIEVKLKEPISGGGRRFFNYGTLTGVLKVDPYLVNDWLLGLYVVEGGELDFGL